MRETKSITRFNVELFLADKARQEYCRATIRSMKIALSRVLSRAVGGGWHDLRHTVTTWALKKYPTKVVAEMLGHASVATTLQTYAHVLQEDFAEPLAEMAGKLLRDVA